MNATKHNGSICETLFSRKNDVFFSHDPSRNFLIKKAEENLMHVKKIQEKRKIEETRIQPSYIESLATKVKMISDNFWAVLEKTFGPLRGPSQKEDITQLWKKIAIV